MAGTRSPAATRRAPAEARSITWGTRVGRIAGFELRIHWSTLLIFGLVVTSLATVRFPEQEPDAAEVAYWAAALGAGLGFYLALLAHEVSHGVLARRHGIEVRSLTLWLLGGVAALEGEPRTPKADLAIAGVGPAVSLTIGAVTGLLAWGLDGLGAPDLLVASVAWLAAINAVLGAFNLIPAAPLDGGRILRAALWARSGDRTSAAVQAGRAGEVFGYLLGGFGLLSLFYPTGFGGLWLIMLGWFIINAARAEQQQAVLRDALGGVTVGAAMTSDPVVVPGDLSVAVLLEDYVLRTRHSAFPVVDGLGRPIGLVTLNRVRAVDPALRSAVSVAEIACGPDELVRLRADELLIDVLPRLNACGDGRAVVVAGDRLVGLLTPTDVTHAIETAGLRVAR